MREGVRERSVSRERRATLGETRMSYLWDVVESGARPLALLNQILPKCLRAK